MPQGFERFLLSEAYEFGSIYQPLTTTGFEACFMSFMSLNPSVALDKKILF